MTHNPDRCPLGSKCPAEARLSSLLPAIIAQRDQPAGFIVANSNHDKFRTWEPMGPAWTDKRREAVVFLRRIDAEKVFAEDFDAWAILPVTAADLA